METIVIVDFGSSRTHAIAERIRQANVFTEIVDFSSSDKPLCKLENLKGIILSDSDCLSFADSISFRLPDFVLESGVPVLGVGFGMHLLLKTWGGKVAQVPSEWEPCTETLKLRTWSGFHFFSSFTLGNSYQEHFSNRCALTSLPKGFVSVAETHHFPHAAVANMTLDYYGFQFNPEQSNEEYLKIFAHQICKCSGQWTMKDFAATTITNIKNVINGDNGYKVYMPLTLSLKDIVAATLVHKAIGVRMICSTIKTPLYRKGEFDDIVACLSFTPNVLNLDEDEVYNLEYHNFGIEELYNLEKLISDKIRDIYGTRHLQDPVFRGGMMIVATSELGQCLAGAGASIDPLLGLYPSEIMQLGRELELPASLLTRDYLPLQGLASRAFNCSKTVEMLKEADYLLAETIRKVCKCKVQVNLDRKFNSADTYNLVIRCESDSESYSVLPPALFRELSALVKKHFPKITKLYYDITL